MQVHQQSTQNQNNLPLPVANNPVGSLEGRVANLRFDANSGTMRIFELEDDDHKLHVIVQYSNNGPLAPLAKGEQVKVIGTPGNHPRFGKQFTARDVVKRVPTTAAGIAKIISGKDFKGIGPKVAAKLVDSLGSNLASTLNRGDPGDMIADLIGAKKAKVLIDTWLANQAAHMTDATLAELGIGAQTRKKIREQIPDIEVVIQTDPYRLSREIDGIGFKTADQLAMKAGAFQIDSPARLSSGLQYALELAQQDGHTGLSPEQLIDKTCEALAFSNRRLLGDILERDVEKQVVYMSPNGLIQNKWMARREERLARFLYTLSKAPEPARLNRKTVMEEVPFLADKFSLSEEQADAVEAALTHAVSVITGGPGTGKTHTIKAIIETARTVARKTGAATSPLKIMCIAPTGKAADRMNQATGHDASTIHMALSINSEDGAFRHDENDPLDADLIIADEFSMVDTKLADSLIRAIAPGRTRLVIVGDIDQLASVDAGRVLQDVIESELFPVTRFTKIRRTGEGSAIAVAANKVNRGVMPEIALPGKSDFVFIEESNLEKIQERIVSMVCDKLPKFTGLGSEDMQVLTPGKNSDVGIHAINKVLQDALNPNPQLRFGKNNAPVMIAGGRPAKIADKVICTRNRYSDVPVFNGDVGTITALEYDDEEPILVIDCGKKVVHLPSDYWNNISHSWALTIHKSQGSEYNVVVIPLTTSHYTLLKRNLFYTGITRARRLCVIIGSKRAMRIALDSTDGVSRQTGLLARIRTFQRLEAAH